MQHVLGRIIHKSTKLTQKFIKMNVFTQKLNPVTGLLEWEPQNENYDFHQEIARSAYADMLHDSERNQKYYKSLRKTIHHLKKQGIETHVLDIGTGTGLLSMMAATCGADTVTACEAFDPIAECAKRVIEKNGFKDKIKVVSKRSTDLKVGPNCDLHRRANILVTELFDTELIGEGAIPTFIHAHQHLLEKDCYVIPSEATVYVQVVDSDFVRGWHQFSPRDSEIIATDEMTSCSGAASVHDCQLSQIPPSDFRLLTSALPVVKFDFTGKIPLKRWRNEDLQTTAIQCGKAHALFMWWDLKMDYEGEINLSCAPKWCHVDGKHTQWRDHWMQAVYFLPEAQDISKGELITISSYHDEYSFWFQLGNGVKQIDPPVCQCGAHVAYSRARIGMMNDTSRINKYLSTLKKIIKPDSICLSISDASLLPLMVAKLGASKVFAMDSESLSRKVIDSVVKYNKLDKTVLILPLPVQNIFGNNILGHKVDVLIGEPYFMNSILPWDNLRFWFLRSTFSLLLSQNVKIMPKSAVLKGVVVQLTDLWKIKAPVGIVEGFNIDAFDEMIHHSSDISDETIEPHPLWEYPGIALSEPWTVMEFDFTNKLKNDKVEANGKTELTTNGFCNAIVLWMEWNLDDENTISCGPIEQIHPGKQISWDKYCRQGVYFVPNPIKKSAKDVIEYFAEFNGQSGDINFKFNFV